MKRVYKIGFYVDKKGNKPVEQYLLSDKNLKDFEGIILVLQRLSVIGLSLLDTNMAKPIDPPLYELRKDRHRIFFAPDDERFVLLSAFLKDSQKTPPQQINRANDYYQDYLENRKFFELNLWPLQSKGKP